MEKQIRSYEVRIKLKTGDLERFRSIYAGYSAGQVRWHNVSSAWNAGYSDVGFGDIRVIREPKYDNLAKSHAGKRGPICLGWIDSAGESWGVLAKKED
jgi:hypothetical protein